MFFKYHAENFGPGLYVQVDYKIFSVISENFSPALF